MFAQLSYPQFPGSRVRLLLLCSAPLLFMTLLAAMSANPLYAQDHLNKR